ncbi:hypothetical protein ACHQM5_001719 [Ranunculus cassubicifolius]
MQNSSSKKINRTSDPLMSPSVINCQSWLNSSDSQVPRSSISNAINSKGGSPRQDFYKEKNSSRQQEQDSSSTQSTGQSQLEVPSMEGGNPHRQSGYNEICGKRVDGHMKPVLSLGTPEFAFCTAQVDYSHALARFPYPYPDPYFGGIIAPCGPQAIMHPSMVNMAFARVPLPLDPAEDEPIYVNPKQYRGILRRRESRAKLEAQNKLIKARKPYLHESRHLHALKRVRGTGGRFLNTKKSEEDSDEPNADMALLKLGGNRYETCNTGGASTTSGSETSSVSGSYNTVQMSDLRFSNYPAHMNGSLLGEGGIMGNGSQYRVPVIR